MVAVPEAVPVSAPPASRRTPSQLMVRIGSAIVIIPVCLAAVAAGTLSTSVLFGVVLTAALVEFYLITRSRGNGAAPWVLFPLAYLFFYRFQLGTWAQQVVAGGITVAVGAGLAIFLLGRPLVDAMSRWALAVAGALYLGWMLGFYMALYTARQPDPGHVGFAWIIALVGSTIIGDTSALLFGSWLGRHPFFPGISPKKTVEGAAAGFVMQTLTFSAFGLFAEVPLPHVVVLGALVAVAAQAGDLIESQFKRAAGVKDASTLIPGHGGMLDRLDSLVLVPAVAYYYLTLVLHVRLPQ